MTMTRVLLLFALAALSAATPGAAAAPPSEIRTVGVISLLGDEVQVFHFGKWFDGYRHDRVLAGADFDGAAEQAVEVRLKAVRPAIVVKRIAIEKADVIADSNSGLLALYNADVGDIRDAIRPWAALNGVDAIIIIRQLNQAVPIQAPQSNFRGLGLYKSFSVELAHPVASIGAILWDGKTLDHIEESNVFLIGSPYPPYATDNEMQVNFDGPGRERLVADLRMLVQHAVQGLVASVGF